MTYRSTTLTAPSWADLWTEKDVPEDLRALDHADFDHAPASHTGESGLARRLDATRHGATGQDSTRQDSTRQGATSRVQPRTWSTPALCDAHGDAIRVLDPVLRAFGGKDAYAGPAVTVSCQQDSSLVAELVEAPGAGRVLVVEDAEAPRRPLLAGAMARRAAHNGWAGVIVQGTVRDVEVLRSTDLGVHALAPSPVAPQHGGTGAMGVPVTVAGVTIHAGDHVYADANGIVVTEGPCD